MRRGEPSSLGHSERHAVESKNPAVVLGTSQLDSSTSLGMTTEKTAAAYSSPVEESAHWAAQQYFDRQFLSFIFVRRLLPFELVWIQAPNGSNDFNACFKRTETASINNVELRTAAELTGKFLEGWLKIILAKENAGQL